MSNVLKLLNKTPTDDDGDNLIIDDKKSSDLPFGLDKVVDTVTDTAVGVKKAFTGEDKKIQFEKAGEITDIDIGFFEQLAPMLKMMVSRSDMGKAEIIQDAYAGDERFGGAFVDNFDNPFILWEKEPYYINKPGATETDFTNIVSEIIKFFPAAKFASRGKSLMGTAGRGAIGYGGTEAANIIGEEIVSPKTSESKTVADRATEVGVSTGIGVATDIIAPKVGGAISSGLRAVTPKKFKDRLPKITKDVYENITKKGDFDLSLGQATSKPFEKGKGDPIVQASPQILKEAGMRLSKGEAGEIMVGLDNKQLDQIRQAADNLMEKFGSGDMSGVAKTDIPLDATESIKKIVTKQADKLKSQSKSIYENQNLDELILTRDGINKFSGDTVRSIKDEFKLGPSTLSEMPVLTRELKNLSRIEKLSSNPNFKQKSFSFMRDYQKGLNIRINQLRSKEPESPQLAAMLGIKSRLDNFIVNGIDNAFIVGDETIIQQLLKANKDYREYMGLTGRGVGKDGSEKAANNILKKLTKKDLDADAVVNTFFGQARFHPSSVMNLVLKKIRENIPKDQFQEILALVKDGVLTKAFSGKGESGITRSNIINNYNQVFKRNKQLIGQLFSKDELVQIEKFKDNVLPTLWAEIRMNPSNSGNLLLATMAQKGLLNFVTTPLSKLTLGMGEVLDPKTYKGIGESRDAVEAIGGYLKRKKAPLFSTLIQAPIRTESSEQPSNIKEIIKDVGITRVPDTLLNKINQAVQ